MIRKSVRAHLKANILYFMILEKNNFEIHNGGHIFQHGRKETRKTKKKVLKLLYHGEAFNKNGDCHCHCSLLHFDII